MGSFPWDHFVVIFSELKARHCTWSPGPLRHRIPGPLALAVSMENFFRGKSWVIFRPKVAKNPVRSAHFLSGKPWKTQKDLGVLGCFNGKIRRFFKWNAP